MSAVMRYAQFHRVGTPDVLEIAEAPLPSPGEGEVLVEIRVSAINPFDAKQRAGVYGTPGRLPQRTGFDGAGIVAGVGAGVEGWAVGDRGMISGTMGTAASHLIVKPGRLHRIPDGIDFASAAAVGVPFGTAYQALRSLGVGADDVLLVHGGSGAVGQSAIQIANRLGAARVIATGGSGGLARIAALGAVAIEYGPGVLDRIRAVTDEPGAAVTVILDAAGTDDAFASIEMIADRGRFATLVAGPRADGLGLTAFSGGSEVPLTPEQHALRHEGIDVALGMLAEGTLEVELGPQFPLEAIADAHRAVEDRAVRGKVLILP